MEVSDFAESDESWCSLCGSFISNVALEQISRVVAMGASHDPTLYSLCADDQYADLVNRRHSASKGKRCMCTDLRWVVAGIIDFSTLDDEDSPYDPAFIADLGILLDRDHDLNAALGRVINESPAMVAKSAIDWWDANRGGGVP